MMDMTPKDFYDLTTEVTLTNARRCKTVWKAGSRREGQRCRKVAMIGSDYCNFHGGRRESRHKARDLASRILRRAPTYYRKHMSKSLEQAISEHLECDVGERFDLSVELGLIRELAGQAIGLYSAAVDAPNSRPETVLAAGEIMRSALQHVVETTLTAARVESMQLDKVSVHSLRSFVAIITKILWEELDPEHRDVAERLERRMRRDLRVVMDQAAQGVDFSPADDVHAMIDSVPRSHEGNGDVY